MASKTQGNDRRARLARAERLLAEPDQRSVLYAALELRQLIELILYEKLSTYSKYIPESVLKTWQPPQAFKALLQFEPGADQDTSLWMAPHLPDGQLGDWVDFGQHKALSAAWLTKNYNKLGSLLHVPHGSQKTKSPSSLRADLEQIASDLKTVVEARLIALAMGERVSLDCIDCGHPLQANVEALRESGTAVCFNPECGSVHLAEEVDGEWRFRLDMIELPCARCGEELSFPRRYVKPGSVIVCSECDARHEITLGWRLLDDSGNTAS